MIDVLETFADPALEAHTSIVFAYNVDLVFYDKLVRRRLASAGAICQVVFCDATPYAAALDAVDGSSRIGRAYSVTPVRVDGAFHPKVYLALGRHKGRLVIGSGNSSIGGLVRNAEVFGRFDYDDEAGTPPHPAFATVFALAKQLAADSVPVVASQLAQAEARAPWLLTEGPQADPRVLHVGSKGTSLVDRMRTAIAGAPLRRVIAVSASFDRALDGVRALARLGNATHETIVIVQGERVDIDGDSVAKAPANVKWGEFVDPRPTKKKEPTDSYAHAKLYIVETDAHDHLFFGSANLSRPALITGANTEMLIQLPPEPVGTWIERLGLSESLSKDARPALLNRSWKEQDDDRGSATQLVGVEWSGTSWLIRVAGKVAASAQLALGESKLQVMQTLPLEAEGGLLVAQSQGAIPTLKFGWLVSATGAVVSTVCAITWPEVDRRKLSGWFGARVEKAILEMQHGDVLGPVLFEFLDKIPDISTLGLSASRQTGVNDDKADRNDDPDRTIDSFYTDGTTKKAGPSHAAGDRGDLDLLASLVQPVNVNATAATRDAAEEDDDEDDDDDDPTLAEEAERRAVDSSKRITEGGEGTLSARLPSAARMRQAGRTFSRRIERAADSLDKLARATSKHPTALPPALLARPVWMSFIAAFVAGRPVETADKGEQVVVAVEVLARYVLRCSAVLAGDCTGGLLRSLDQEAAKSRDGDTLRSGVEFLVSACAWSVAWLEQQYAKRDLGPAGVLDTIPLFVLARLLATSGSSASVDATAMREKIGAWNAVPPAHITNALTRARQLARWIQDIERSPPSAKKGPKLERGTFVYVPGTGVAVVLGNDGDLVCVAMLRQPRKPVTRFSRDWLAPLPPSPIGQISLRPIPREFM